MPNFMYSATQEVIRVVSDNTNTLMSAMTANGFVPTTQDPLICNLGYNSCQNLVSNPVDVVEACISPHASSELYAAMDNVLRFCCTNGSRTPFQLVMGLLLLLMAIMAITCILNSIFKGCATSMGRGFLSCFPSFPRQQIQDQDNAPVTLVVDGMLDIQEADNIHNDVESDNSGETSPRLSLSGA